MSLTTTLMIALPYFILLLPKSWFDWLESYRLGWIIFPVFTVFYMAILSLVKSHEDEKEELQIKKNSLR